MQLLESMPIGGMSKLEGCSFRPFAFRLWLLSKCRRSDHGLSVINEHSVKLR